MFFPRKVLDDVLSHLFKHRSAEWTYLSKLYVLGGELAPHVAGDL